MRNMLRSKQNGEYSQEINNNIEVRQWGGR